jgi:anthranilate phosphoribosyltransferase
MRDTLETLLDRRDLGEAEAEALLRALTDPALPPAMAGALLAALRAKGVSAGELRGFARAMRALARQPEIAEGAPTLDIVGTGGDRSGSVNLSTGSALLAAACGVRVVKHGNRSVSSRAGSADVLEALGLSLPLDEAAAGALLARCGFTFLFAPYYHPAMKALAPVRAALGVRTAFNILGPLTNPAAPAFHLIGAFDRATARLMANALAGMPIRRAFVVHGAEGWDEPTPIGPFQLFDVVPGRVIVSTRDPQEAGIARCVSSALLGGDAATNAAAIARALRGEDRGPVRDALVLGTGLALELMGEAADLRAGLARAGKAIDDGAAARVLAAISATPRSAAP